MNNSMDEFVAVYAFSVTCVIAVLDYVMVKNCEKTFMRIMQPATMRFVHAGGVLGCICTLLIVFSNDLEEGVDDGISPKQLTVAWLGHIGFWCIQGTLLMKAWRTQAICAFGMKRVRISNQEVSIKIIAGLIGLILFLVGLTVALGMTKCIVTPSSSSSSSQQNTKRINGTSAENVCKGIYQGFNWGLVVLEFVITMISLRYSWKGRNAPEGLHDTRLIVNATTGLLTTGLVCVPLVLSSSGDFHAQAHIVCMGILVSVTQVILHTTASQVMALAVKQKWTIYKNNTAPVSSRIHPQSQISDKDKNISSRAEFAPISTSIVPAVVPADFGPTATLLRGVGVGAQPTRRHQGNPLLMEIKLAETWWFAHLIDGMENLEKVNSSWRNVSHSIPILNSLMGATRGDRELLLLVDAIQVACKAISAKVTDSGSQAIKNKSSGSQIVSRGGSTNSLASSTQTPLRKHHGHLLGGGGAGGGSGANSTALLSEKKHRKLDLVANQIMAKALFYSKSCCVILSSEQAEPLIVPQKFAGNYCVAYYPLNGSSNLDCNVSVGTIFSIWRKTSDGPASESDILRSGRDLICAGYCMYSFSTELIITFGNGVKRFTLDAETRSFDLTDPCVIMPPKPKHFYSTNESHIAFMDPRLQLFVNELKTDKREPYSLRYIGSMIADVHRTILYGGVYMYPSDRMRPNGKLHTLYECAPMAMIVEQAGGEATTGMYRGEVSRILDIEPKKVHDLCPFIVACTRDMNKLRDAYMKGGALGWGYGFGGSNKTAGGVAVPLPGLAAKFASAGAAKFASAGAADMPGALVLQQRSAPNFGDMLGMLRSPSAAVVGFGARDGASPRFNNDSMSPTPKGAKMPGTMKLLQDLTLSAPNSAVSPRSFKINADGLLTDAKGEVPADPPRGAKIDADRSPILPARTQQRSSSKIFRGGSSSANNNHGAMASADG